LGKTTVSRALTRLKQQGLINRNGKNIGFQKDWELWKVSRTANNTKLNEVKINRTANSQKLAAKAPQKLTELLTQLAEQPIKVCNLRDTQKKLYKKTI
jgi:DNA-binding transcriptional regulator YhcF (GntR family)